ncbi:hypothetical protein CBR_g37792 [Chara braunii]|uniref:ZIP family transporter n=1 Tax=Chara braunii TaxID=69332 RepID=A0A388LNS5_CHABU|nr:hypothetical protein CBR_g37792 [Chara braunii]|eukprot:GBG83921.1 hypothetical protein CBR_g37792 [Chara braunii]
MAVARGEVAIAFLLTTLAGLATVLGAGVVFFASLANRAVLAVSLGLAAGVMLLISFYDLLALTAVKSFMDGGLEEKYAKLYALLSFFGGVLLLHVIDGALHGLANCMMEGEKRPGSVPPLSAAHGHGGSLPSWMLPDDKKTTIVVAGVSCENEIQRSGVAAVLAPRSSEAEPADAEPERGRVTAAAAAVAAAAGTRTGLNLPQSIRSPGQSALRFDSPCRVLYVEEKTDAGSAEHEEGVTGTEPGCVDADAGDGFASAANAAAPAAVIDKQGTARLLRTGLLTAVVIGVHNFPEGVATFVSSVKDAKLGGSMCLAIALHNIPEGICVSMPVFYATGSKKKAFLWTILSAMAEPFGGLLAYVALANVMSDVAFGILFGGIAGVMITIVLVELLPAARKYDPEDKYVSPCLFVGMAVMALSLVLFDFSH